MNNTDYSEIINTRYSEPAAIICYKDGDFRLLDINKRFLPELWMNISEKEFLNTDKEHYFDDENMRIFINAIKRCADTGSEQEVETWRSVSSDCCGFDKICLRSRLIHVDDTPDGAVIYEGVKNVSNEKRAQDSLADIEYRYKSASEQINIYNWEYSIDTKEMRPCYRCMRDLGLPALVTNYPEPAIDAGIFPPDYADMYRDMMRKVDEGIPEIEADIPLTVGRVPFRVKYTTEFDEAGKPVKAFGSATLISETELGHIKLDNQIISTLAEEYKCIYLADFVSNSVKIIKQDGIFTLNEDAYCKELSDMIASKLEVGGKNQRLRLGDVSTLREVLFKDCENREFVYKDDDKDLWIRINYHVVERGALGVDRLLITASVVDDIRAQKMEADRLIETQNEELEDRQKMLLAAINEANNANKAKTEFFSNMSHDIRTPMNAINGFSKLAVDEIDNREHLREYLDKIVTAGDHLMSLINDILDMSRIESGKMELSYSPVRLKDLLLGCADMIRVKMNEKNLTFTTDLDGMGEDTIECDKLHFNQVILNLLSNAYKFTPEGGAVTLTGRLVDRGDMLRYEIRVKDTGIGMSDEFREQIWEAYSREKTETVHETQGTGLGMVIVRNIVNMMQGTIDVVSEQGRGSEFMIILPLKPAEAASGVDSAPVEAGTDNILDKDFSGITVLVVDDTPMNLNLADKILRKSGFDVKTIGSGIGAIELIKASKPGDIDIILMDVLMPVMDGLETTRRIRAIENPQLSAIPIIAMTANAFDTDVKKALDAGMDAHVPKPFKREELLSKIDAHIRKH